MLNNGISAEFPHMEHIARNAANHLIPTTYGLQYTAVNSISNMYPTAYLSNSRKSVSFSSIVELNNSLSTQVLIHV